MNNTTTKPNIWKAQVHAPFKKVIAFDLLFLGLGIFIGAGIITAILVN
jgi:hypothetical protein